MDLQQVLMTLKQAYSVNGQLINWLPVYSNTDKTCQSDAPNSGELYKISLTAVNQCPTVGDFIFHIRPNIMPSF